MSTTRYAGATGGVVLAAALLAACTPAQPIRLNPVAGNAYEHRPARAARAAPRPAVLESSARPGSACGASRSGAVLSSAEKEQLFREFTADQTGRGGQTTLARGGTGQSCLATP